MRLFAFSFLAITLIPLAEAHSNEGSFDYIGADMRAFTEGTSLDKINSARVSILAYFGPIDAQTEPSPIEAFAEEAQRLSFDVVATLVEVIYPSPDQRSERFLRQLNCWERLDLVQDASPMLFFAFATMSGRSCIATEGTFDRFTKLLLKLRDLEQTDCMNVRSFEIAVDEMLYEMSLTQRYDATPVHIDQVTAFLDTMQRAHCD